MKKNKLNSAEALKKLVEELSFEIQEIEAFGDNLLDLDLNHLIRLRSWVECMQEDFRRLDLLILENGSEKVKKLLFELRNLPKFERL